MLGPLLDSSILFHLLEVLALLLHLVTAALRHLSLRLIHLLIHHLCRLRILLCLHLLPHLLPLRLCHRLLLLLVPLGPLFRQQGHLLFIQFFLVLLLLPQEVLLPLLGCLLGTAWLLTLPGLLYLIFEGLLGIVFDHGDVLVVGSEDLQTPDDVFLVGLGVETNFAVCVLESGRHVDGVFLEVEPGQEVVVSLGEQLHVAHQDGIDSLDLEDTVHLDVPGERLGFSTLFHELQVDTPLVLQFPVFLLLFLGVFHLLPLAGRLLHHLFLFRTQLQSQLERHLGSDGRLSLLDEESFAEELAVLVLLEDVTVLLNLVEFVGLDLEVVFVGLVEHFQFEHSLLRQVVPELSLHQEHVLDVLLEQEPVHLGGVEHLGLHDGTFDSFDLFQVGVVLQGSRAVLLHLDQFDTDLVGVLVLLDLEVELQTLQILDGETVLGQQVVAPLGQCLVVDLQHFLGVALVVQQVLTLTHDLEGTVTGHLEVEV